MNLETNLIYCQGVHIFFVNNTHTHILESNYMDHDGLTVAETPATSVNLNLFLSVVRNVRAADFCLCCKRRENAQGHESFLPYPQGFASNLVD